MGSGFERHWIPDPCAAHVRNDGVAGTVMPDSIRHPVSLNVAGFRFACAARARNDGPLVIGRYPKDERLRRETFGFPLFVYRAAAAGGFIARFGFIAAASGIQWL
jgi:hypothetical protein